MLSDRALGAEIAAGNRGAFAELFRRYRQPLYGYCVSILGNQDDSADALQNTMARALKALPGDRREIDLKPWLFRVAHNECIDLIRSRKPVDDLDGIDLVSKQGLEAEVAGRERLRELLGDLELLPERQRSALVMRELNGMSFEQIGTALETAPANAKQMIYEARLSLQEYAEGRTMQCDPVREAISERDGRVLRGRKLRGHLRSCQSCQDFKAGIGSRRNDLRMLIPPIPAATAAALVDLLNGPGGGGAAVATGLGGLKAAIAGSTAKSVAVVATVATVGAGGVGLVEVKRQSGDSDRPSKSVTADGRLPAPAPAAAASFAGAPEDISRARRDDANDRERSNRASKPNRRNPSGLKKNDQETPRPSPAVPPAQAGSPGTGGSNASSNSNGNFGGTGGSKGLGATPTHEGKPAQLPEASAGGQEKSSEAKSTGGKLVSPGNSGTASGSANPGKSPDHAVGSGK